MNAMTILSLFAAFKMTSMAPTASLAVQFEPEFYEFQGGANSKVHTAVEIPSTKQPVLLFAHGIGGDKNQVFDYLGTRFAPVFPREAYTIGTFNFREVTGTDGSIRLRDAYMAQDGDIKELKKAVDAVPDGVKIVGVGVSRGASTWLTFLGTYPDYGHRVAALVLESPFADFDDVLGKFLGATARGIGQAIIFRNYSRFGIKPIKVAKKVPKNIPMLFIHSLQDTLIPYIHSLQLYATLREDGHEDVYLLPLEFGDRHAGLFFRGQGGVARKYLRTFFERYDLPWGRVMYKGSEVEAVPQSGKTDDQPFSKEWLGRLTDEGSEEGLLPLDALKLGVEGVREQIEKEENG